MSKESSSLPTEISPSGSSVSGSEGSVVMPQIDGLRYPHFSLEQRRDDRLWTRIDVAYSVSPITAALVIAQRESLSVVSAQEESRVLKQPRLPPVYEAKQPPTDPSSEHSQQDMLAVPSPSRSHSRSASGQVTIRLDVLEDVPECTPTPSPSAGQRHLQPYNFDAACIGLGRERSSLSSESAPFSFVSNLSNQAQRVTEFAAISPLQSKLYDLVGISGVIFLQLVMYAAAFWLASVGSKPTRGLCWVMESADFYGSLAQGSWFTGLALCIAKRLHFGASPAGVAVLDDLLHSYGPAAAFLANAQIIDLLADRTLCEHIQHSEVLQLAWVLVCVIGWMSAWEAPIRLAKELTGADDFDSVLLSLCNPVGAFTYAVFQAMRVCHRFVYSLENDIKWYSRFREGSFFILAIRCLLVSPIWLLVSMSHGISYLAGISRENPASYIPGAYVCCVATAVALSYSLSLGGLGGVSIAVLAVGAGGLHSCLGIDRALWLVWWGLLLYFYTDTVKLTLFADGVVNAGYFGAAVLPFLYIIGRNYKMEKLASHPYHRLEPVGWLVGRVLDQMQLPIYAAAAELNIFTAAKNGDRKAIAFHITKNPDSIYDTDSKGNTALHVASEHGHSDVAEALLQQKTQPNAENGVKDTPLHLACRNGHDGVAHVLLQYDGDLTLANANRDLPIHEAARHGSKATISLLLQYQADVRSVNARGNTALHEACYRAHDGAVRVLIDSRADVHALNKRQSTPLYEAAKGGSHSIAHTLINEGADPNASNREGLTALHAASRRGHDSVVHTLINAKADVHIAAWDAETALHVAAEHGRVGVIHTLILNGSDVNAKTMSQGQTPLHRACALGRSGVVIAALLEHQASVNARDKAKSTPLHLAAFNGHSDIVQLLADRKADMNAEDRAGFTALHKASQFGSTSTVLALLEHKADPRVKTATGSRPLDLARHHSHKQLLPLLS